MLQIKKKASLLVCKYNLQFLFRNKTLSDNYQAKKLVTNSIILRAPKHFNIGKQKISNLNYKTPKLIVKFAKNLTTSSI